MKTHDKVASAISAIDEISSNGCAIGIRFVGGKPTYSHFTYSPEFLSEYEQLNLARIDATLHYGFRNDGIEAWSALEKHTADRQAFALARQYGIEDGICFALTVEGHKTIASVSQSKRAPLSDENIARIYDLLVLASFHVSKSVGTGAISSRSLEWCHLAAKGLSDTEIADELALSIHGARARRRKALDEIGAKTPAEAIYKATQRGALQPYAIV